MKQAHDINWTTIQSFYDEGNSLRDITKKFGVASLTIQRAKKKGLFVSRPKNNEMRRPRKTLPLPKCEKRDCSNQVKRRSSKFCSQQCHKGQEYANYIDLWLSGTLSGWCEQSEDISRHVRRHLREIKGSKCWECGWDKVNPYTGNIPVQIDHIDGNCRNNHISNLRLICPSCHSLTKNWGGANKNSGRVKRRLSYSPTQT